MLKKILGEVPFDVSLKKDILLTHGKKVKAVLLFDNTTGYDLPLSCNLTFFGSIKSDICSFDVIIPAQGNTEKSFYLSLPDDAKIHGTSSIFELEVIDRILDSKAVYEISVSAESVYKCCESPSSAYLPSDDMIFTRNGIFYANKGEIICLEVPKMKADRVVLHIIKGSIQDYVDGQEIELCEGLNRLCFEMTGDGSFEFTDPSSGEKVFIESLNPKYFILELNL